MKDFPEFPKIRPLLNKEYKEIYVKHYTENRAGSTRISSISSNLEKWMHKKVAEDVLSKGKTNIKTLEVGCGNLNHLDFEQNRPYDVVEPFEVLFQSNPKLKEIRRVFKDIHEIELRPQYNRIINIATFEHVLNLPEMLAICGLLLEQGGELRSAFPCEGKFLWSLAWRCTTGIEFRLRYGLKYSKIMQYEHVNNHDEIVKLLNYFFEDTQIKYSGLGPSLSFYCFARSCKPKIEACKSILKELQQ